MQPVLSPSVAGHRRGDRAAIPEAATDRCRRLWLTSRGSPDICNIGLSSRGERGRSRAYLSEITFDPTCGFAVPRRCAVPGAAALDRSAGETVQRWPSSVTTVTDLRL